MNLTKKEAFRLGFFKRAAEMGYAPEEMIGMVKQSEGGFLNSLGNLSYGGLLLAAGIPALTGVGTGLVANSVFGGGDQAKQELAHLKKLQLISEIQKKTEEINRRLRRSHIQTQ